MTYDENNPRPYIEERIRLAFEAAGYTIAGIEHFKDDSILVTTAPREGESCSHYWPTSCPSDDDGTLEFLGIDKKNIKVVLFPEDEFECACCKERFPKDVQVTASDDAKLHQDHLADYEEELAYERRGGDAREHSTY